MQQRQQINSLQVFRGLAALAVVVHHAAGATDDFIGNIPQWIHNTLDLGMYGVDFFFVLSGFIIMYVHQHDTKSFHSAKQYMVSRFIRVFPIYWLIAIAIAAAYTLLPGLSAAGTRDVSLIGSVLLLPSSGVPILSVAWTLIHEVMFYIIFLLFFINTRAFVVFVAFWLVSILYTQVNGGIGIGAERYLLSLLNIEFILGMLAAWLLNHIHNTKVAIQFVIAGSVIGFASLYELSKEVPDAIRLIFALSMSMLILGMAVVERQLHIKWPSILLVLGNASYSIYLIHKPAQSVTQRMLGVMDFDWIYGLIVGVILTTAAGVILHLVVEKPIINLCRKRLKALKKHRRVTT
ncbi:acyltransferase family protein [Vibrio sp. 10N.286.48.B7]|uniref:acyltransferase family protein n=1 Tax=Vibrio sp. 10N.286.48.B7 TaxID=1880853 RepID=UPI000C816E1C|nr:acyltransferase [Vibrio sp. 10N.286.48.B7]PMH78718.1 hypothetical protein BCU58_07990 [Vibrio sp. 10N.286.48.B7]